MREDEMTAVRKAALKSPLGVIDAAANGMFYY